MLDGAIMANALRAKSRQSYKAHARTLERVVRAGRSILGECMAVVRYRRILATLRHTALLLVGIGVVLGSSWQMFQSDCDAALMAALFVAMLWGTFIVCVATWRLL